MLRVNGLPLAWSVAGSFIIILYSHYFVFHLIEGDENLRCPIGIDSIDGILTQIEALCPAQVHAQYEGTPSCFGTVIENTYSV